MGSKLFCISYFMVFVVIVSTQSQGGWIPLSRDDVLGKLDRGSTRRLLIENTLYDHALSPDVKMLKNNAIKVVDPQNKVRITEEITVNGIEKKSRIVDDLLRYQEECNSKDCTEGQDKRKFVSTLTTNRNGKSEDYISEVNKRRAKLLKETDTSKTVINDLAYKHETPIQEFVSLGESFSDDDEEKTAYRVTEDISDIAENGTPQSGYTYKSPTLKFNNGTKFNITNTLFNILSKYNIKAEDDLPNYVLSRQNRVGNSNFMLIPVPLKTPPRFQNLNQFAVDPVLAVFLSNYGYYLPGLYGIRNKYRNLYGYLASNNFHNNRPFGSYKIFSDTDSSN